MTIFGTRKDTNSIEPKRRSTLGLLFNPHLGSSITPLRESTRMFLHLVAGVFAVYGLLPKTYPGLQDSEAPLSFSHIIATAWQNVRFTREGAPQAILFFTIVGVMIVGALVAISALMSLFIGHAHAQSDPNSMFTAPAGDIAQSWIDFLFNGGSLGDYSGGTASDVSTNFLQSALVKVLAFYSDAILIIAAIILFYHLTAMVVETAHHGVVMGKRASQIWAPIRLVVAIGLLVPINGGLNSGQYIVIKMAELGSGLATNTWNQFLTALNSYSSTGVPMNAPIMTGVAMNLLLDEACMLDYNTRLDVLIAGGVQGLGSVGGTDGAHVSDHQSVITVNGHGGVRHSFSTNDVYGQCICGAYFSPNAPGHDDASVAAFGAEIGALGSAVTNMTEDAKQILTIMPTDAGGSGQSELSLSINAKTMTDVIAYQQSISTALAGYASNTQSQASTAIGQIQQYGWVFAGALMPVIEREQGMISNAVNAGMPLAMPPDSFDDITSKIDDSKLNIVSQVLMSDIPTFQTLEAKAWSQAAAAGGTDSAAQCAVMLGLQDRAQGGMGQGAFDSFLQEVDKVAAWDGVWQTGTGAPCAGNTAGMGLNTFKLGINLNGGDIIGQLVSLGHSNLSVAINLIEAAIAGKALGGIGGAVAGLVGGAIGGLAAGAPTVAGALPAAAAGASLGAAFGGAVGALMSAAAGIVEFFAFVFFTCGFVLAFLLPMFPFTRMFFAVLSWIGAIIEAIIAIPLVALAHLNPEGEGLPGASGKQAYFYVFNLFLFPVLTVFGLVAGLLVFMIAANFMTYAYNLAVASSGGTAYGHEVMSKLLYSVLYVATIYICANHAFAMITHVPQNALKWMGASGQSMPALGDASHLAQTETMVAGYLGKEGMGAITGAVGGASQAVGQGIQGAMKGAVDYGTAKENIKLKGQADDEKTLAASQRETDKADSAKDHKEMLTALNDLKPKEKPPEEPKSPIDQDTTQKNFEQAKQEAEVKKIWTPT
jgi:conjugal transfer/type IV secretion protein DotA/TraY